MADTVNIALKRCLKLYSAVLIAGLFVFSIRCFLQSKPTAVVAPHAQATRHLPANHRLTQIDLLQPIQSGTNLTSISNLLGKFLVRSANIGDVIKPDSLSDFPALDVSDDSVVVSVPVTNQPFASDFFDAGSTVNLIRSNATLATNVRVLAWIGNNSNTPTALLAGKKPQMQNLATNTGFGYLLTPCATP
jgi:hypothetical protein